jgi:hypothetical protein
VATTKDSGTVFSDPSRDQGYLVLDYPVRRADVFSPDGEFMFAVPGHLFTPISNGRAYLHSVGLTLVDAGLKPIWQIKDECHHMISTDENENAFCPSWRFVQEDGKRIRINRVIGVDQTGRKIFDWDEEEHRGELTNEVGIRASYIESPNFLFDHSYMNLNGVTVIPENDTAKILPAFRKGNLFVSEELSHFFILDRGTGKVVYSLSFPEVVGQDGAHSAQVLANGHILFYNNHIDPSRYPAGPGQYSQVVEMDPVTKKVVWSFSPQYPNDFYNYQYGAVYPLPNGDLVVSDAHRGRVFEISKNKKLRWEWFHPERDKDGMAIPIFFAKKFPAEIMKPFLENN